MVRLGIPAAVLVLRKNKSDQKALFIDASRDYWDSDIPWVTTDEIQFNTITECALVPTISVCRQGIF